MRPGGWRLLGPTTFKVYQATHVRAVVLHEREHLAVDHAFPGGHPLEVAVAVAAGVAHRVGVVDHPGQRRGDRLEPPVWMLREPRNLPCPTTPAALSARRAAEERTRAIGTTTTTAVTTTTATATAAVGSASVVSAAPTPPAKNPKPLVPKPQAPRRSRRAHHERAPTNVQPMLTLYRIGTNTPLPRPARQETGPIRMGAITPSAAQAEMEARE